MDKDLIKESYMSCNNSHILPGASNKILNEQNEQAHLHVEDDKHEMHVKKEPLENDTAENNDFKINSQNFDLDTDDVDKTNENDIDIKTEYVEDDHVIDYDKSVKNENDTAEMLVKTEDPQEETNEYLDEQYMNEAPNIHSTYKQGEDGLFHCKNCEKKYKRKKTLRMHEKVHSGNGLICSYCKKCYPNPYNLKEHERIHTGEKPFKCGKCDRSFSTEYGLKRHTNYHNGTRFKCNYCEKSFSQRSYLLGHQKCHNDNNSMHGNGRCKYCNKQVSPNYLKAHERLHTGETPFKCEYCDESFGTFKKRKCHQLKHTGYNCKM